MIVFAAVWLGTCCIGAPAILGLWLVQLMRGKLKGEWFATPIGIAAGISVICAASALAVLEPEVQRQIGPWVVYTCAYAGVTFLVGIVVGWAEAKGEVKVPAKSSA